MTKATTGSAGIGKSGEIDLSDDPRVLFEMFEALSQRQEEARLCMAQCVLELQKRSEAGELDELYKQSNTAKNFDRLLRGLGVCSVKEAKRIVEQHGNPPLPPGFPQKRKARKDKSKTGQRGA